MMRTNSRINIYLNRAPKAKPPRVKTPPPKLGYLRETETGSVWIVDWHYNTGDLYGHHELSKIEKIHPLLDTSLINYQHSQSSIIDTETTGLAGGTGTYAFIIGSGFWKGETFIVRQYMMRDFNEEPAQLTAFSEDLGNGVCSYNGKSFDIPLLRSRFNINRLTNPIDQVLEVES